MDTKLVDTRRLAGTWYTADANANAIAAKGQTLVDDLLGLGLMVGVDTLNQCDGLRENGHVALRDAFDHLGGRQFTTTEAIALQIRVDDRGLFNATIDLQSSIFSTILGMFHNLY